jgi:hypothetical protein
MPKSTISMKNNLINLKRSTFTHLMVIGLIVMSYSCSDSSDDNDNTPKATKVTITSMVPDSPATIKYYQGSLSEADKRIQINYDYSVVEPDGVRIWIEPYITPPHPEYQIFYSPSPLFQETGIRTVYASVKSEAPSVVVDKLIIKIRDLDQNVISETMVDVNYTFSD